MNKNFVLGKPLRIIDWCWSMKKSQQRYADWEKQQIIFDFDDALFLLKLNNPREYNANFEDNLLA